MKKKLIKNLFGIVTLMFVTLASVSCSEESSDLSVPNQIGAKNIENPNIPNNALETDTLPECITDCLNSLPTEDLSDAESNHLQFMREEEYLAHDVYVFLYNIYNIPVFNNISKSEQFHTSVIKVLLDKYELDDPASEHITGVFEHESLQDLYDLLTTTGSNSLVDALTVGATIEDLDIYDLEQCLNDTDNEDITLVFNSLSKGSRNHMRAFSAHLSFHEVSYEPQYISQNVYDEIIANGWEIGNGICLYCNSSQDNNQNNKTE